jgi:hypothetical protein
MTQKLKSEIDRADVGFGDGPVPDHLPEIVATVAQVGNLQPAWLSSWLKPHLPDVFQTERAEAASRFLIGPGFEALSQTDGHLMSDSRPAKIDRVFQMTHVNEAIQVWVRDAQELQAFENGELVETAFAGSIVRPHREMNDFVGKPPARQVAGDQLTQLSVVSELATGTTDFGKLVLVLGTDRVDDGDEVRVWLHLRKPAR